MLHSLVTLKGVGIIPIYQMRNVKPRKVLKKKKVAQYDLGAVGGGTRSSRCVTPDPSADQTLLPTRPQIRPLACLHQAGPPDSTSFCSPSSSPPDNSDLIACTVITKDGGMVQRFLAVDIYQMSLVEPDVSRLGWGVVKFAGLLQV